MKTKIFSFLVVGILCILSCFSSFASNVSANGGTGLNLNLLQVLENRLTNPRLQAVGTINDAIKDRDFLLYLYESDIITQQ